MSRAGRLSKVLDGAPSGVLLLSIAKQRCSESLKVKSAALKIITFPGGVGGEHMITVPSMNITISSKRLQYGMSQQSQFANG